MTIHLENKKKTQSFNVRRGDIFFADLGEGIGSEQNGVRPVLVLQNDIGNRYSPTTIVALITSINKKMELPIHYEISSDLSNLPKDSTILLEQIRTIDKKRLLKKVSTLDKDTLAEIDKKVLISLGITNE